MYVEDALQKKKTQNYKFSILIVEINEAVGSGYKVERGQLDEGKKARGRGEDPSIRRTLREPIDLGTSYESAHHHAVFFTRVYFAAQPLVLNFHRRAAASSRDRDVRDECNLVSALGFYLHVVKRPRDDERIRAIEDHWSLRLAT